MKLSRVARNIPDFHVLRIDRLANDLSAHGKDVIKLNLGKSEVPMQEVVADEVARKIYDKERREIVDAQGLFSLREAIAKDYKVTHGISVDPDLVFINNGTSPFFLMLYTLLLEPGDEVFLPLPYYPPYVANAVIAGVKPIFYHITDEGRIDLGIFAARFRRGRIKLVFLNSPGNPLGNVITKDELECIRGIVGHDTAVVSDEIYSGMVYGNDFCPALSVFDKERTVVLNGFSKIHHMYTRRLGYAIVSKDLREPMLRYQRHNVVCVDPVTQFAGLVSLQNKAELLAQEVKKELARYRRRLEESRNVLRGTPVRVLHPAGSFYMPANVSACLNEEFPDSLSLAEALLRETHVAVTPGEDFGRGDLFRVGLTSDRVVEGVERIKNFVSSL